MAQHALQHDFVFSPQNDLQKKALEVHRRLAPVYGCPIAYFRRMDPMSELVSSFLNHRTRNRDARVAFDALRERFATWDQVRDAPAADIAAVIGGVRWPEQKAERLKVILAHIGERLGGRFDLDHLGDMPVEDARAWLEALPGIGPKTSAAVLSFSKLRGRALPVDSHHHRVAQRLGLIPPKMGVGPCHAVLEGFIPDDWSAQNVYDHHQVFMRHGQKVCHHSRPECDRCPVRDLCEAHVEPNGATR